MTSAAQALAALKAAAASIPAARVPVSATVVAVESYSNGYTYAMTARLADGSQDVRVPLYGPQVKVGQGVRLTRAVGEMIDPAYEWAGREDPDTVFAEFEADPDVPEPAWGSPALTSTAMAPSPGGQMAVVTARIRETPEKYSPRMTEIRWQVAGEPTWHESLLPNVANEDAEHVFNIPASFPLGVTVNVQARTHTQGRAVSLYSQLRSIVTAVNTTVPGAPAAVTVALNTNLTAIITFPPPSQPRIFDHWELSVADSAAGLNANDPRAGSGAPVINAGPGPQYHYVVASPRAIYIRVREVTSSGVAGNWWPASDWSGPYNIIANDVVVDTTPPAGPPTLAIATVTATAEAVQGVVGVTLTTTLAAYPKPPDFSHFLYRYYNPTDLYQFAVSSEPTHRFLNARQGVTYQVAVQAWDVAGNASVFTADTPVATPTLAQPPTPGAAPTLVAHPRAVLVSFAATPETTTSGRIVQYELQRAPDVSGSPGTWATVHIIPAPEKATAGDIIRYIDAGAATRLDGGVRYHWRYRPVNAAGIAAAGFSPSASTVTLLIDGADLVIGSVLTNRLEALLNITAGRRISVGAGGVIDAASGNVALTDQGLDLKGLFVRLLNAAGAFVGSLGRGVIPNTATEALVMRIEDIVMQSAVSADSYFLFNPGSRLLSFWDGDVEVLRLDGSLGDVSHRGIDGVVRRNGYNAIANPDPEITQPNYALSANTDYVQDATIFQVPIGAKAVHLRGTAAVQVADGKIYAFATGGGTENGMFFTAQNGNRALWTGPPVPLTDGRYFTFRADVNWGVALRVVGYEW